jgi:orotidine-5'-phosphate decarboxylase
MVIDAAAAENAGAAGLGSVGVVIGATVRGAGREHDELELGRLNGPLLAPGIGAQGATADDLRAVFGSALGDVLPSSSREVLSGGPTVAGLRQAATRALDSVSEALAAS